MSYSRRGVAAVLLALALPAAALAQGATPLRKTDLVRYLSSTTYSKSEIAGIIQRSCLAFVPTARDRSDLKTLGATPAVLAAISACTRRHNRPGSAPPPPPLQIVLPQQSISAPAGTVASFAVDMTRGSKPAGGVRLVLGGSDQIPGGAGQALTASTDPQGHAVFAVPAGTTAGTYTLTVESVDGSPLRGNTPATFVTLPASPTAAAVTPAAIDLTPTTPERLRVTVTLRDPFGNASTFQRVELRPAQPITGLSTLSATTNESGIARFELPTAPLRDQDTLLVAIGSKTLVAVPVSAAGQVAAQTLEAARLQTQGQLGAAEAVYDSILAVQPANTRALLGRGFVRSRRGKYSAAQQDYLTVLHDDSTSTAAHLGLGDNFARNGNYARAQREFEQALRLESRSPEAATGLADIALWRYDPRQAAHRLDVLNATPRPTHPVVAAAAFREGIDQLRHGERAPAEHSLSAAITGDSSWAEAYYYRGLAYDADGQGQKAVADLERYLQLRPTAPDRDAVNTRIEALAKTPGTALGLGILLPGLGQFYTHRPAFGLVVLAGVAGGAVWALQSSTTLETRTFTPPFGAPYTDQVPVTTRPHLTAGVAAAGAVWALSALEAYLHVRRARSGGLTLPQGNGRASRGTMEERLSVVPVMTLTPAGPAFGAGIRVPFR